MSMGRRNLIFQKAQRAVGDDLAPFAPTEQSHAVGESENKAWSKKAGAVVSSVGRRWNGEDPRLVSRCLQIWC